MAERSNRCGVSLLVIIAFFYCSNVGLAQSNTTASYGNEFYIGFMRNIGGSQLASLRLIIGTPASGNVQFTVENSAGMIQTGTVTSNTPVVVTIGSDQQVVATDFSNRNKGIHVYSNDGNPLYVVVENSITFLNHGVNLAYPCLSLGENVDKYEYGVVSVDDPTNILSSQFLLVGCEDNTTITITPEQSISLPTDIQQPSADVIVESGTESHKIVLNKMQTLLVLSVDDLSGSKIVSNKPLTIISGHECGSIPLSEAGCEPIAVQVPPVSTWGTKFLLAPFAGRDGPQAFKAVSSKSNTSFTYTCDSNSRFAPNTKTLSFFSSDYCYLESTDPIFMTELSFGGSIDRKGDPAISIVSPIDQYIKTVDFVSLATNAFSANYISVTVTVEDHDPDNILLDGNPINCEWQEIKNRDIIVGYGCNKSISSHSSNPTKHTVLHSSETGRISVLMYGFNAFPGRGYSYLSGQLLQIIEGPTTIPTTPEPRIFLPFVDLNDFPNVSKLKNTLADATSEAIVIPDGLIFGKRIATLAYVSENGVISFNKPWKYSIPDKFPTNYYWTRSGMAIAPFWSDNDIRKEGTVKYITYHSSDANTNAVGKAWLDKVNRYIQMTEEGDSMFQGDWLLTVHWDQVHPSPHGEDDHRGINENELEKTNSYQATIITNVTRTYAVFTYKCGAIQWSALGRNKGAVIGYNSEGNFFENHPLSGFSGIGDVVSCTFDIGKRKKRQVQFEGDDINDMRLQFPADSDTQSEVDRCLDLVRTEALLYYEFQPPETPETLAEKLLPCPCSEYQAYYDEARFIKLNDSTKNCYISAQPIPVNLIAFQRIDLTQMCCYDHNSALQTSQSVGFAGTMLFFHPASNKDRYQEYDQELRRACCEIGDDFYCGKYFQQRIINKCENYSSPSYGGGYNDPHYYTLDREYYSFQGEGFFILLNITSDEILGDPIFTIQGRMQQLPGWDGVTLHTELAFGRRGLSYHCEAGFKVYQTHTAQSVNITDQLVDGESFYDPNGNVELRRTNYYYGYQRLLVLFYETGIALELIFRASGDSQWINFAVRVPPAYNNRTQGFLGNFDGDYTNEFHTRESLTPVTFDTDESTERQIFSHLNSHWKLDVMSDESLFSLDRQRRQVNQPFVPIFFDDLNVTEAIKDECEGSRQCILDLIVTEVTEVALDSLTTEKETNMTVDTITNNPPTITADEIFIVYVGVESSFTIVVDDPGDEFTLTVDGGLPPNSVLEETEGGEYIFRWNLQEVIIFPLRFIANDSRGASSLFVPTVEICACVNGGNCTREGLLSNNATVVLNCVCPEAFSGTFCEEDRNGCSEIQCFEGVECMDVPAPGVGAVCGSCPEGYTGDTLKCYDINECELNSSLCGQNSMCENTEGSFLCTCSAGFQLITETHQCQDVDECLGINDCQQLCQNTEGSYTCSCMDGFTLDADGRNCTANEPCDGECSYGCAMINNKEQCYCPSGQEIILPGGTQCADINECENTPGPCSQVCKNTEGSFECDCLDGYRLQDDKRDCKDIDECLEAAQSNTDLCQDKNSECVNIEGSYMCTCVPGYENINNTCSRNVNEAPPPPPPVVTPTSGIENSINYTAPNLTPETFTPALQQKFREITSEVLNTFCAAMTCTVVLFDRDIKEIIDLKIVPTSVAIPTALIDMNDFGQLTFVFYVQLPDSFMSKEDLQLALLQSDEKYREAGFLTPFPTTQPPTTEEDTTTPDVPISEALTTTKISTTDEVISTTEPSTTTEAFFSELPATSGYTTDIPVTDLPTTDVPTIPTTTEAPMTTERPTVTCPPICEPVYCNDRPTRRAPCTIQINPANRTECTPECRITFCHTCYYADEDRPLIESCDTCTSYPLVSNISDKCYRRWAVCTRRANAAIYPKERGRKGKTLDRFRCYEHPCS